MPIKNVAGFGALCAAVWFAASSTASLAQEDSATPFIRPTSVLELPEAQYFPESVTAGRGGELYVSSISLGAIYRFPARSTTAEPFLPIGSRTGVAGVNFDKRRGVLWACIVDLTPGAFGSTLEALNPDTAATVARYPLPGAALCADIAVAGPTAVYVTDTNGSQSQIFKLTTPAGRAAGGSLASWANDPAFTEPVEGVPPLGLNGIVYDPAVRSLYVGKYNSGQLFRVAVLANGNAGTVREVVLNQNARYPTLDGIRLLAPGLLLGAVNTGPVVAISVAGSGGSSSVIRELDQPSSLAISVDGVWVSEGQVLRQQGIDPSPVNLPFKLKNLNDHTGGDDGE
jgi:sugar lactone lactonase YvrE